MLKVVTARNSDFFLRLSARSQISCTLCQTSMLRTRFTSCNNAWLETWFQVPNSHRSLSCLTRKYFILPNSPPIKMENREKFRTLLLPDQEFCALAQNFWKLRLKIIRQLRQAGLLWPKQIRQPCWILSPSEGVLACPVSAKDISF